jgi:hypothetical protein
MRQIPEFPGIKPDTSFDREFIRKRVEKKDNCTIVQKGGFPFRWNVHGRGVALNQKKYCEGV